MNRVSWQWKCPQRQPLDVSYSCTSCCPTGCCLHGTAGHKSRLAVWKTAHYTGAAADLTAEPFETVVDTYVNPVFAGKIAES